MRMAIRAPWWMGLCAIALLLSGSAFASAPVDTKIIELGGSAAEQQAIARIKRIPGVKVTNVIRIGDFQRVVIKIDRERWEGRKGINALEAELRGAKVRVHHVGDRHAHLERAVKGVHANRTVRIDLESAGPQRQIKAANEGDKYDWGSAMMLVEAAHKAGITGKGQKIANIDTGANNNNWIKKNLVELYNATDEFGPKGGAEGALHDQNHWHGTHTISTSAGRATDGTVGVAKDASVGVFKVLKSSGSGTTADVMDGMAQGVKRGYHVMSMSLGSAGENPEMKKAADAVKAAGVYLSASAGNSGGEVGSPGRYAEASVAALDKNKQIASFSSRGPQVTTIAPGVGVKGAAGPGDGVREASGTSMAAPHVTGLVALVRDALGKKLGRAPTYDELHKSVVATAQDLKLPKEHQGNGLYSAGSLQQMIAERTKSKTSLFKTAGRNLSGKTVIGLSGAKRLSLSKR